MTPATVTHRPGIADREAAGEWPADEHSGYLHLSLIRAPNGRTVLRERRQRFPLRTTAPFHIDERADDMAFIYVQNPTGGVFGGDRLDIAVSAGPGTRVHLTSQSATKIYRTDGTRARQELRMQLSDEAYVEHIPDTLIPHAGSDYEQITHIDLAPGAMLINVETVASGRVGFGERFAYRRLVLETLTSRDGKELFADRMRFEPGRVRPDRSGMLGGWDYLVCVTVLAPERDVTAMADAIDAELANRHDVCGAAGELPRQVGAFARVLAPDAISAGKVTWSVWAIARRCLLGIPPPIRRK